MDTKQYIKTNEGLRLKPYRCTAGKLTIGYGRNIEDIGITESEADVLLNTDIATAVDACKKVFPNFTFLNSKRQTVLIDMMFNLGYPRFSKFVKMIEAVKSNNFDKAAVEILDSLYAKQVPNRANNNSRIMKEG